MLQDRATSLANHARFVERVLASRTVWGLRSAEGWAICDSAEQQAVQVMPFWSDSAYAARAATGEWANYSPAPIDLDDFIDTWLRGMHEDGVLVGTNWDANNCGLEVDPKALAGELTS